MGARCFRFPFSPVSFGVGFVLFVADPQGTGERADRQPPKMRNIQSQWRLKRPNWGPNTNTNEKRGKRNHRKRGTDKARGDAIDQTEAPNHMPAQAELDSIDSAICLARWFRFPFSPVRARCFWLCVGFVCPFRRFGLVLVCPFLLLIPREPATGRADNHRKRGTAKAKGDTKDLTGTPTPTPNAHQL